MTEEVAFVTARHATSRIAFSQFRKAEGEDEATIKAAAERFRTLPLLLAPELRALSHRALEEARGRIIDGNNPFAATLWIGGAEDTYSGRNFLDLKSGGTLANFVRLLNERTKIIAPKRTGWVIEPTTNPKGRRTNEETLAVHALFLDCDGAGVWDPLLDVLRQLNYCFVAYQSGGWTPSTPKWRVVLPLDRPHDTSSEAGRIAWKAVYNHARVIFGACGQLLGVGFDPATETPCCPWFLTEKRAPEDPERLVIWQPGHALDLTALTLALPEVPQEETYSGGGSVAATIVLDDERLNTIIDALVPVTASVPVGRRDLYLALPGALLDRGICPDDVLAIIEAVSASYPRPHADKHADNLHNARTTINKWLAKDNYTRIGTLNSVAPTVAEALDRVLPDLATKMIADSMQEMLEIPAVRAPSPPVPTSPDAQASSPSPSPAPRRSRGRPKLGEFGHEISALAKRLRTSKKDNLRLAGLVIACFVRGEPLPISPLSSASQIDDLVQTAMRALGRGLPLTRRWQEVLDFTSHSLLLMDFTQSLERVAAAERAFYEGQAKRHFYNKKKEAEVDDFKRRHDAFFKGR